MAIQWVSIRSPHQSKGRPAEEVISQLDFCCFNPLPSPKQGETQVFPFRARANGRFQSAPLTKARGDAGAQGNSNNDFMFQSAPLTKARGDSGRRTMPALTTRFNPLPSPKQGETAITAAVNDDTPTVSIRSPHQSKGRPLWRTVWHYVLRVSIRSPHQSKGRPPHCSQANCVTVVSIRSPHQSKGRPVGKALVS